MRTTIRLDDTLYRRAKARATQTGRTVSQVIEDALRESLRLGSGSDAELAPLTAFGGSGVMPGVDLTSSAAVRDAMDGGVSVDALR
jgi:hypothetical protein